VHHLRESGCDPAGVVRSLQSHWAIFLSIRQLLRGMLSYGGWTVDAV